MLAYWNGDFVDETAIHIAPNDMGLLRGFAVYEGITSYNNKPFRVLDHWNRLNHALEKMNIENPWKSHTDLNHTLTTLLKSSVFVRSNFRLVVTGGSVKKGIHFDGTSPTYYILMEQHNDLDHRNYTDGARCTTDHYAREFPESKHTNYIRAVQLHNDIQHSGSLEIIYTHNGTMLECTTSNIAIVKNGIVHTPLNGVLHGVTMRVVLELANSLGISVVTDDVSVTQMFDADEVFITSSFKDIVPVVSIDDHKVADGHVGSVTTHLMSAMHSYVKN